MYEPTRFTVNVWPCCPLDGDTLTVPDGSIVRLELFELEKVVPVAVVPEMVTRYATGALTTTVAGTTNVTLAVVPTRRANPVAIVLALGPLPGTAGVRETVMLPAVMVPAGN